MLKNEFVNIKLSSKNISYYKSLLNIKLCVGDIIKVESSLISNGSSVKITGICDICGKEKILSKKLYNIQSNFGNNIFTCSKKCSIEKTKISNIKKYGVDNIFKLKEIKDKIKEKNTKKYGVDNPQKLKQIRNKTEITNILRYGYSVPSKSDIVKSKIRKTNNIRFGVNYPAKNSLILEKMKLTSIEKYGVDNFSKTKEFKDILFEKSFQKMCLKLKEHGELIKSTGGEYYIKCSKCSNSFKILYTLMYNRILNDDVICTNCNPKKQTIQENSLFDFIKMNYSGNVIKNCRNIISKELDIYIPELKLAFEFNGLYWHSDLYKSEKYHLDKTKECENIGIQLIHIYEDDWLYKQNIVKSIIINKISKSNSIYARKTEIKEINDNKLVKDFLNKNHIQGFVGSSIKLGLFYENELVCIMTFGKLRKSLGQKSKEGYYELLRFCNKIGFNVIGGASKLITYFINKFFPKVIISYSDNSRYSGYLYKKLGFELSHITKPNYYWVIDGIKRYRFNYRKDKLVKMGYDINKTEIEIMRQLGYYRIFDSGSRKWTLNLLPKHI